MPVIFLELGPKLIGYNFAFFCHFLAMKSSLMMPHQKLTKVEIRFLKDNLKTSSEKGKMRINGDKVSIIKYMEGSVTNSTNLTAKIFDGENVILLNWSCSNSLFGHKIIKAGNTIKTSFILMAAP